MNTFARSLASAQESVLGFDTTDVSSLAYVSGLVALETLLPHRQVAEIEFMVEVHTDNSLTVDLPAGNVDDDMQLAINLVASHYFHARMTNIPVSVH